MLAIFKRELAAYFRNITGFIFMGFFLLISGLFFTLNNLIPQNPNYTGLLGSITFIFLIVVPILTMRLISEETRQKTDQLLLTSPLSIAGMVLGKYFAALTVFLLTLVITFVYPFLLSLVGTVTLSEIIGGYAGFFLLGASFISVGLFISSLTDNQVIAAVVTFSFLLLMWIIDFLQQGLPGDRVSGLIFAVLLVLAAAAFIFFTIRNLIIAIGTTVLGGGVIVLFHLIDPVNYEGFIIRFLRWFSLLARYRDFNIGVLGLSPIVYYLSFCSAFIFLTVRVIEKKRWK